MKKVITKMCVALALLLSVVACAYDEQRRDGG